MVWTILGLFCLAGVIALIFTIKQAKLGPNSSKALGALFAIIAYFSLFSKLPIVGVKAIVFPWINWVVPGVLIGSFVVTCFLIYKKRDEESKAILENTPHILGIVILSLIARFLFSV